MIKKEQPASSSQVVLIALLMLAVLPVIAYQSLGVSDRSYSAEQFFEFCGSVAGYSLGIAVVLFGLALVISDSQEALDKVVDVVMWPFIAMIALGLLPYLCGAAILRLPLLETTGAMLVWGFCVTVYMIIFSRISRFFPKRKNAKHSGG